MSANSEKDDKKVSYTSEYYSYHRNMMILFILSIITIVPGVSIDPTKLGPLKSSSSFIDLVLPISIWLAALYHWALFHAEWKECAEPHRTQVENALSVVDAELGKLSNVYDGIQSTLQSSIVVMQQQVVPAILAQVKKEAVETIIAEYQELAKEISQILLEIPEKQKQNADFLNTQYENFRKFIHPQHVTVSPNLDSEIEIFLENIRIQYEVISSEHGMIFANITHQINASIEQKGEIFEWKRIDAENNAASSKSLLKSVENSANLIKDSVNLYQNQAKGLGDLVASLKIFSHRKRIFVWAKTDFAGISIPKIFFVISMAGILYHYISMMQRWLLSH